MDARVLKQQRRCKRYQDQKRQLDRSITRSYDQAWADANPQAVYHKEAEQRRREGAKSGASAKHQVAKLLYRAASVSELCAVELCAVLL